MLTPQERGDAGFSFLTILVLDPPIRSVMQVCINNFCMVGLLYADHIYTLGWVNLVKCFVLLQTEYLSGYRGDQSLRAAPVCNLSSSGWVLACDGKGAHGYKIH